MSKFVSSSFECSWAHSPFVTKVKSTIYANAKGGTGLIGRLWTLPGHSDVAEEERWFRLEASRAELDGKVYIATEPPVEACWLDPDVYNDLYREVSTKLNHSNPDRTAKMLLVGVSFLPSKATWDTPESEGGVRFRGEAIWHFDWGKDEGCVQSNSKELTFDDIGSLLKTTEENS